MVLQIFILTEKEGLGNEEMQNLTVIRRSMFSGKLNLNDRKMEVIKHQNGKSLVQITHLLNSSRSTIV